MKIKRSLKKNDIGMHNRFTTSAPSTEDLMKVAVEAKKNKEEADRLYKMAQEQVIERLEAKQQKSASVKDGGKKYKITYVKNERTTIDSDGLKKEMGARAFNKYTVRTLDKKKLEEGIALGDVDQVLVGKHVSIQPSSPFLRITEQATDDQET